MTTNICIYHAGPLFTTAERIWNLDLVNRFSELNERSMNKIDLVLPQDFTDGIRDKRSISRVCLNTLDSCQGVLCNLDGSDPDSGTSFEIGYAYAQRGFPKVIAGYRTDFRNCADSEDSVVNSMIDFACDRIFVPKHIGGSLPVLEISTFFLEKLLPCHHVNAVSEDKK